jgi:hypothetical protein
MAQPVLGQYRVTNPTGIYATRTIDDTLFTIPSGSIVQIEQFIPHYALGTYNGSSIRIVEILFAMPGRLAHIARKRKTRRSKLRRGTRRRH